MIVPPTELAREATPIADAQALFAEARRRRRRRWAIAGSIGLGLAATIAIGLATAWPGGGRVIAHVTRPPRPRAVPARPFRLTAAAVAWIDSNGGLEVGNVANLAERVVATINDNNLYLVQADGRIYWADGRSIWALDLRSGTRWRVASGQWVTTSANGRELYVAHLRDGQADTLTVVPVHGHSPRRLYTLPAGWQLSNSPDVAVANGLVIDSYSSMRVGTWDLGTERVRAPIGLLQDPIGSYTPPGADYSLLAWAPGDCRSMNCPIGITNTATLATVTIRSPYRYGFLASPTGIAFSPDGSRLAVFANLRSGEAELALVNTRTGAMRLDPRVKLYTTELSAWVVWLGSGRQLLAGAANATYAIEAGTLASRPFSFLSSPLTSEDIGFSATAIPASALSQRALKALRLRP